MTETIDLVGMGLAWEKDIKQHTRFRELTERIKHKIRGRLSVVGCWLSGWAERSRIVSRHCCARLCRQPDN